MYQLSSLNTSGSFVY